MPDRITVAMPNYSIAAYATENDNGDSTTFQFATPGTISLSKGSSNPSADFNIFITGSGFDSEGHD